MKMRDLLNRSGPLERHGQQDDKKVSPAGGVRREHLLTALCRKLCLANVYIMDFHGEDYTLKGGG